MRIRYFLCFFILISAFVSNAVYADNWGELSSRLEPGMTEQEVIKTIGYKPTKVELQTCGSSSASGAWQCKIYTFGDLYNHLDIMFRQENKLWLVNNWSVFP